MRGRSTRQVVAIHHRSVTLPLVMDAQVLLRSLKDEPLSTVTGKWTMVRAVGQHEVLVTTRRSSPGRPVEIAAVQDALDRLRRGKTIPLDPSEASPGFVGAVLKTLPQVEFIDGTPVAARIDPLADTSASVLTEFERRLRMWAELLERGGPLRVRPRQLRELGINGGQQGIWVDAKRTREVGGQRAVTVGVKHNGRDYPDEVSYDVMRYHYPVTRRRGHDRAEIDATKVAGALQLPVFVTIENGGWREVKRGWIADWNDAQKMFLIEFGSVWPRQMMAGTERSGDGPFELFDDAQRRLRLAQTRPNQTRFKAEVIARYGGQCAVCPISARELMTAAHIVPVGIQGADDPRNGLPLCANHHAAFDRGLLRIEPGTTRILLAAPYLPPDFSITRTDLRHLPAQPATEALCHRWESSSN